MRQITVKLKFNVYDDTMSADRVKQLEQSLVNAVTREADKQYDRLEGWKNTCNYEVKSERDQFAADTSFTGMKPEVANA